jgi:hypothetical protein
VNSSTNDLAIDSGITNLVTRPATDLGFFDRLRHSAQNREIDDLQHKTHVDFLRVAMRLAINKAETLSDMMLNNYSEELKTKYAALMDKEIASRSDAKMQALLQVTEKAFTRVAEVKQNNKFPKLVQDQLIQKTLIVLLLKFVPTRCNQA